MPARPPRTTLFPYTTLFRSIRERREDAHVARRLLRGPRERREGRLVAVRLALELRDLHEQRHAIRGHREDRKSTRLNSSHVRISYAVFCLKKKTALTTLVML